LSQFESIEIAPKPLMLFSPSLDSLEKKKRKRKKTKKYKQKQETKPKTMMIKQ